MSRYALECIRSGLVCYVMQGYKIGLLCKIQQQQLKQWSTCDWFLGIAHKFVVYEYCVCTFIVMAIIFYCIVACCYQALGFHASLITLDQRGVENLEHKAAIRK